MAKRKSRTISASISPIHPSLHFVLFLVLALILVVVVAVVMQQTSKATRASLLCPSQPADPVRWVEELSSQCKYGVQLTKDANGCSVWTCKTPPSSPAP